jgi:hypothetical protein
MALATLCSSYQKQHDAIQAAQKHGIGAPKFVAFVVDHQLREGSSAEARIVASRLRTLSIMPFSMQRRCRR